MENLLLWIRNKLQGILSPNTMPDHLTHTQIRELAASVVEETGMGDHIKKLLDAKDETERSHVRMEWERKMADRENQRNLQSR